jgi:DNA repair exonuclease SbcCD ATPase subunit
MDDKKNLFIAALVVLLLISAVWGQKEAGRKKELVRENTALHTQLQEAGDAVKISSELQADAARQKEARQQTAAQLENARQKIDQLKASSAGLEAKIAEQSKALVDLQAEKEKALAAAEEAKNALAGE